MSMIGPVQQAGAATLVETVARVKRSVVAVGTYMPTRSPALSFGGTGFVAGDGLTVITNSHVVPDVIDTERKEALGVLVATAEGVSFRPAVLEVRDREHDLARLRLSGAPLVPLSVGDAGQAAEGQALAFTGFPLGVVLGLHPVTHRAMLSAITPAVMPVRSAQGLNPRVISQLRGAGFKLFQLDATAYPGNSGSPLYDPETGVVMGIINMGMVKGGRENAITNPSGISYAVPAQHIHALMQQKSP
ncbi:S1 family peptidase [Massilia yuzhufengensis]|nr:serine protease [Massilia yuzhufengensis]